MYLFSRQARLNSMEGVAWAANIGKVAAELGEHEVDLWMRAYSPGFGVVVWTSWWDTLVAMESGFAKFTTNEKYLSLAAEGRGFLEGEVDDTLYRSLYDGSGAGGDAVAQYVSVVQAVCANGNLERGMMAGVEIAQKAEAATGRSTGFVANVTGHYGGVGWLAGYQSLAEFEDAQDKLNTDASFVKFVDSTTGAYVQDPSVTQTLLFAKVG
jgi:hypothetical protein